MPTRMHKDVIVGCQALIGHLMRQGDQKTLIASLREYISDIQRTKSAALDIQGRSLRPMQDVCMKGKSYTVVSLHVCGNVWAAKLVPQSGDTSVLIRTATEVIGW